MLGSDISAIIMKMEDEILEAERHRFLMGGVLQEMSEVTRTVIEYSDRTLDIIWQIRDRILCIYDPSFIDSEWFLL